MRALALLAALMAQVGAAASDSWTARAGDDGRVYYGGAKFGEYPQTIEVYCAGRSPQNLPFRSDDPMEFLISQPGLLSLDIQVGLLAGPELSVAGPTVRTDVMIVVGTQGFRLPALTHDELWGGWTQDLQPDDALIAAMASGQPMELRTDGGVSIPLAAGGAPEAFAQMQEFCSAYLAPPTPASRDPLIAAAEASITGGCNGPAAQTPLLAGDFDQDGAQDYVLDWAEVSCANGQRLNCGAANCLVEVFLSSRGGGAPERYYGISAEIKPGAQGVPELWSYTVAGQCPRATLPDQCAVIRRWDGAKMGILPTR